MGMQKQDLKYAGHAKRIAKPSFALLAAFSIALLLGFINGSWNIELVAIFFFLAVIEILATEIMLERNAKLHDAQERRVQLVDCLYRAVYSKPKSGSYMLALQKAQKGIAHAGLRDSMAKELKARFMSSGAMHGPGDGTLLWRATKQDAEARVSEYMLGEKSRKSRIEETAQRYATFNMFASTILPSFMIFAFIGSYVLSQATGGLLFLSASLLALVPTLYSVGNTLMWRRLLG